MTRVKLNLASGTVQERELITAFKYNDIKYVIFDGESTGSMGLPIILVCKEVLGKVVGITDAEEWKNTKECLKKIIAGESLDYINIAPELRADDIFYRQLTLPVASFDALKNNYKAPEVVEQQIDVPDNTPVFETIAPEDVSSKDISFENSVAATDLNSSPVVTDAPEVVESAPVIQTENVPTDSVPEDIPVPVTDAPSANTTINNEQVETNNYEKLKEEFLNGALELFNKIYNEINHND